MKIRFENFIITVILIMSYFIGLLSLIGFELQKTRLIIYSLVFVLFIATLLKKEKKKMFPQINELLILTAILVIGNFFNQGNWISFFRLYIDIVVGFLFFYSIVNFKNINVLFNKRLIIVIFFFQFIAVGYKFIFIGIQEDELIGTMSNTAGSLSVIFPLFASTIIIPYILIKFSYKYLAVLALLVFFSIVGDKRAMVFFFPVVFFFGYLIYNKLVFKKLINIKRILAFSLLGICVFYIGSRALPSLNPENEVWGEFNFEYTKNYIIDYNAYGKEHKSGRDYSRINAPIYFMDKLANMENENLFLGLGPILVNSKFADINSTENHQIDFGYQGRASFNYLIIQIGLLGLILILYIYVKLFIQVIKKIKSSNTEKAKYFLVSVILMFFIWILDFFFYSDSMYLITPMVLSFHLAIGIALNKNFANLHNNKRQPNQ